jgi:hypothetical protein
MFGDVDGRHRNPEHTSRQFIADVAFTCQPRASPPLRNQARFLHPDLQPGEEISIAASSTCMPMPAGAGIPSVGKRSMEPVPARRDSDKGSSAR